MYDSNHSHNIPLSILIEYHEMGFKLVPLCEDGKTPNVQGLLTPDERQRSIDESKDGKEHEINYIYSHPEFWNKERLEKETWRFKNIATLPGRIHLQGEDGRSLYLNVLDIDSKEVFTILNRLSSISTGKDFYFIEEVRKNTFVSKTKKKYGRHIFWFSSEQHKHIGTIDCKQGCEFEIKTDNSLGLITLPPSRHRDDPQTRYQSIGQNKIQLIEPMYDKLLEILDDCLKKIKPTSNPVIIKKNSRNSNKNNDVEFIQSTLQSIADYLMPFYRTGYRHHIIMGLVGMLHKHNLEKEYARKIIEILTIGDEESEGRFLTLEETYNKHPKEVSGYNYFLSVLENTCGDRSVGVRILRNIQAALDGIVYHNDEDQVVILTGRLENEYIFKSMRDTGEIHYYDINKGVYIPNGKCLIEEQLKLLCPDISTHKVQEVIQKIRRRNPADRNDFDPNDDIINVRNGLLDVRTGELKNHTPNYLSTIQLPLVYNSSRKCPSILKFLTQVLHPQDIFTAMEIIGYILLKSNKYEKAFMLFGSGDNGKSVFIKLVESFVGPQNTSHVTLQDLDGDRFSSADLYGKLVNTFADLQAHKLSSTGTFKTLVSGDSIRAQFKYGQPFSLVNKAKLIFSANKIPDSDDTSHAYYKRWLILAFEKSFGEGTKDTNLIHKLTTPEELSGLLNFALVGLRQLEKEGGFRDIPVEEVKRDYERKSNTVMAFLGDMCRIDLGSPEFLVSSGKLYDEYTLYCKQRKERPLDANIFGMELKKVGIEKNRIRNNGIREYYYLGVQLVSSLRGQSQASL
jgi:P4 family phage/plasmid primase-like protien